jgi:hypothetical protein
MERDLGKTLNMELSNTYLNNYQGSKYIFIILIFIFIFVFREAKYKEHQYRRIFGCESGSLPLKYLGVPIHYRKLKNPEWNPVESRSEGKLGCWQSKMLSYGDRLVLINIVFTTMPMFILSFLEISNEVRKICIFIDRDSFGKMMRRKRNIA